jgi:hypothetical protein
VLIFAGSGLPFSTLTLTPVQTAGRRSNAPAIEDAAKLTAAFGGETLASFPRPHIEPQSARHHEDHDPDPT